MKIVSFTGAHCTGKTTLLQACKHRYGGVQVEVVPEVTRKVKREYGEEINEGSTLACQYLIAAEHLQNAFRRCEFETVESCPPLPGSPGITKLRILDRCAVDGFIYAQYLAKQQTDEVAEALWWKLQAHDRNLLTMVQDRYDILFYTDPSDVDLVDDGVRSTNDEFREGIIKGFEKFISDAGPNMYNRIVRLKGTVEERLEVIDQKIRELVPNIVVNS
jgi:nicotinamide riboside kinase